tara:strand:+ start:578 stop:1024 length:447 start_codon:yes stop_codon:yes gene_type:complete
MGVVMIHDSIWISPHFQSKEFACNCGCGENEIHQGVVHVLEEIRKVVGVPLRVSSGVRCSSHNRNVGGASNSFHQPQENGRGYAADFTFSASSLKLPINILRLYVLASEEVGEQGGVILYPTWVHVDCRGALGHPRYRSTAKFNWPRL